MKNIIITLFSFAGVTAAAETIVWDLSTSVTDGTYLYDSATGKFTDNADVDGTVLNDVNGSGIQTSISFTLNLTDAKALTSPVTLLNMDMTKDIGLIITDTGLTTTKDQKTLNRYSVTWTKIENSTGYNGFVNAKGDTCITLTFVQTYDNGVQIWDNSTNLINDKKLIDNSNTSLTSIYVNGRYVEAIQFAPGLQSDNIVSANKAFATTAAAKLIPEPTTATLSLLALAGLAARRRRASR